MKFFSHKITLLFLIAGTVLSANTSNPVRVLLQENRLDEALMVCRQFEVLPSRDIDTMLACAWVYFRTEHNALAEKILEKNKMDSHIPDYQLLTAYSMISQKKYDQADMYLENLRVEHKGTRVEVQANALRAEIKELQGKLPSAAFIYMGVVHEDPNNGRAHWALGRHYKDRGDVRLAIEHLEKTANLWPKHVESRYELATLYLDNGGKDSLTDANKWAKEAYNLNRADGKVLELLGTLFEKNGKILEAVKYWQKAVESKKDLKLANQKLNEYFDKTIDALMESKKWKDALGKLDGAGKSINEQPKYILRHAIIIRNLDQHEKAVSEFLKYLKINPKDPTALRELGICYINLKKVEEAYDYFSRAVNAEPDNGMNYAWLAFGLESKGEWDSARDAWRKAVETIKDPTELEKANRKLANIEKKLAKKRKDKDKEESN